MKAYELLARDRWWTPGAMNVFSAINSCYDDLGEFKDARKRFLGAIGYKIGDWDRWVQWEADPSRTQAEVVALLKELDI